MIDGPPLVSPNSRTRSTYAYLRYRYSMRRLLQVDQREHSQFIDSKSYNKAWYKLVASARESGLKVNQIFYYLGDWKKLRA